MGIPAVALMLSNEFMMEGCLIMLLMLIQPCFICRLVLRFSFKRSLLSILFIYGPLALILFTLLWSFSRMAESTPF